MSFREFCVTVSKTSHKTNKRNRWRYLYDSFKMPATKRFRTTVQPAKVARKRRVKAVQKHHKLEDFHAFESSSSASTMTESTCPSEKDSPHEDYREYEKISRFESFQPHVRGKRKNYVRSTSKMSLSRRYVLHSPVGCKFIFNLVLVSQFCFSLYISESFNTFFE